jgi:endoglucanase
MPVSRRRFLSSSALAAAAASNLHANPSAAQPPAAVQPPSKDAYVRVKGNKLLAPGKEKLLLRGINLGNWLEPEGYMFLFEGGPQSPREIEAFFNELIGPSAAKDFWMQYRRAYITKADIDFIRASGLNSVRIPLHYKFFLASEEGFSLLDPVVAWCRDAGLWVILDLHCAPGGQTGANIDDSWGYPWLFESPADQQATIDVWTRIAQHYREEPAILGFDLLNEPLPQFPGTPNYNPRLAALYRRIVTAIREIDKNHIIVLGGAQWDTNFGIFDWPMDSKVIYTFHAYWNPPTLETIQSYVSFAEENNAPLWLGESGENTDQWIQQFVQVLEKNHVGWCFWPYKKMEKPSCMASIVKPTYWDDIVAFAKLPGGTSNAAARIAARPSLEHSRAAAQDLLEKIRFDKCRVNPGYLQALGLTVPPGSNLAPPAPPTPPASPAPPTPAPPK